MYFRYLGIISLLNNKKQNGSDAAIGVQKHHFVESLENYERKTILFSFGYFVVLLA